MYNGQWSQLKDSAAGRFPINHGVRRSIECDDRGLRRTQELRRRVAQVEQKIHRRSTQREPCIFWLCARGQPPAAPQCVPLELLLQAPDQVSC
jgi:hypothetical protein